MSNVIDLRDIDIRTDTFKSKVTKDGYSFKINVIFIENVPQQIDRLCAVERDLRIGDSIHLDTDFGWHDGKEWLTFPLKGIVKVLDITIKDDEIRFILNPIKLKFPFHSSSFC